MTPANIALQIARCEAKIAFKTWGKAVVFIDKRKWRSGTVYKCPVCGYHHVTTQGD